MHPSDLAEPLGRLDPGSLTAFAGALLQAEAARLGLSATSVVVSQQLTVPDGGLDLVVRNVPPGGPLPAGTSGWQLKSSKGTAVSALGLPAELAKPGVVELLAEGGTYVLLWPRELNPRQEAAAMAALRQAAPEETDPSRLVLFDAAALAALAVGHPAIVEGFGLSLFGPLRALDELGRELLVSQRAYVADAERDRLAAQLRELVAVDGPEVVRAVVLGLPGTGKTRLVYEALAGTDFFDRALHTDTWEGVERFLAWAVREPRSHGLLIVDDCGPDTDLTAIARVEARLLDPGSASARWRVIAIASIIDSRPHPDGHRDLVLRPLSEEATVALVGAAAELEPALAGQVAGVAEGFPALAFALARSVRENPDMELGDLVHLHEPSALLERALGDAELQRMLGPLALFGSVGVEGEDGVELAAVAAAFDLPLGRMRSVLERERRRHRFVTQAGPYRFVTPQALAVWLAVDVIESTGDFDAVIAGLPRGLRRAFHDQLALFGGSNEALSEALKRMITASGLITPETFDDVAADLVRAAATTIPATVGTQLNVMLSACDDDRLRRLPRPGLLGAVIRLVREPTTVHDGLTALFALARVEAAEGLARTRFLEAFDPQSGATEAALVERVGWLRSRVAQPVSPEERALLFRACHAVATAQVHDGSSPAQTAIMNTLRGARDARGAERWRVREAPGEASLDATPPPQAMPSLPALRREGVDLMLRATSGPLSREAAGLLAEVLPGADSSQRETVARLVRDGQIDHGSRPILLRVALVAGTAHDGWKDLAEALLGDDDADRAQTLLALPARTLLTVEHDREGAGPRTVLQAGPVLAEAARRLAAEPRSWATVAPVGGTDAEVARQLWRGVARHAGARTLVETLGPLPSGPAGDAVLAGALSAADETCENGWASAVLEETIAAGQIARALEILVVLRPQDHRITGILRALESADVSPLLLARLAGDERTAQLGDRVTGTLVRCLRDAGASLPAMALLAPALASGSSGEQVRGLADELRADPIAWRVGDGGAPEGIRHELADAVEFWHGRVAAGDDPDALSRLSPISATCRLAAGHRLDAQWLRVCTAADVAAGKPPLRMLSFVDAILDGGWRLDAETAQLAPDHVDWGAERPGSLHRRILALSWVGTLVPDLATTFVAQQAAPDEAIRAWRQALADTRAAPGLALLAEHVAAAAEA